MPKMPWGNPPRGANTRPTHDRGLDCPKGGTPAMVAGGKNPPTKKPNLPVTHATLEPTVGNEKNTD